MKLLKSAILVSTVFCISNIIYGQETQNHEQMLTDNIQNVTIKDEVFEQSFAAQDADCIYKIAVNNLDDEELMEYIFNAADLNEYKISFKTSKSSVYVTIETKGGKDLIKSFENGQTDGYVDDFVFYAKDIEQARKIVEEFRSLVKSCEAMQESVGFVLGDNATLQDAVTFLQNRITKVTSNEQSYDQSFSSENAFPPLIKIEVSDINDGEVTIYELNAADLNAPKIDFDTDDEFVEIEASTKGERDLIKVYENGELDGYEDDLQFYAEGVEDARKLVETLRYFVQESEKLSSKEVTEIENTGELKSLNDFIVSHLTDVSLEDENFKQTFTYQQDKPYLVTITIEETGEGEISEYHFNLADISENSINFDTESSKVVVEIETVGEEDLIKENENGVLDEYDNELEILANGIEEGRHLVQALKKAVSMSKKMQEENFISGNTTPTKNEVVDFLSASIGEVVIGEDAFQQKITSGDGDECIIHFEVIDVSEGETTIYKFNLMDINPHKLKFYADDQEVFVSLQTVGEKELIEEIVDGTTEGFEDEIDIRAEGIEEARKIQKAMTYLINACNE